MDNSYEQDYRTVLNDVTRAILEKIPVIIIVALIFAVIGWGVWCVYPSECKCSSEIESKEMGTENDSMGTGTCHLQRCAFDGIPTSKH